MWRVRLNQIRLALLYTVHIHHVHLNADSDDQRWSCFPMVKEQFHEQSAHLVQISITPAKEHQQSSGERGAESLLSLVWLTALCSPHVTGLLSWIRLGVAANSYRYAKERGYFMLSENTLASLNVTTINVTLASNASCFGSKCVRHCP